MLFPGRRINRGAGYNDSVGISGVIVPVSECGARGVAFKRELVGTVSPRGSEAALLHCLLPCSFGGQG